MPYKHETTRRHESQVFEGVVFYLHKMTEGRRLDIRSKIAEKNRRIREIIKEQAAIEKVEEGQQDGAKWLELQDEFDGIMIEEVNPTWIQWGVKKIEGLEADGKPLGVDDWKEWPSALFDEILRAVKSEAELNGTERKNLPSPTTSGEPAGLSPSLSIVPSVDGKASGGDSAGKADETAESISLAK
jgi:hypothetical protein